MSIKLGNTGINKLYLGSGEIKKAYLGNDIVFDNSVIPLYDDVSAMYTLRRPNFSIPWTKVVMGLRRTSDNTTTAVFFDNNGKISLNSTVTAAEATLGDWVGSGDAFVEFWQGITPDNTEDFDKQARQNTSGNQPKFISSGTIITKNGEPTIDFLISSRFLEASLNIDLDSGKEFTFFTVANNVVDDRNGSIFVLALPAANPFQHFSDRRIQRNITAVRASGSLAFMIYLAQQNTSDQKILTSIIRSDKTGSVYYNSVLQENDSWTGSYGNNTFIMGTDGDGSNNLNGTIQEITIFPSDLGLTRSAIESDITTYYSIP